MTTPQTHDNGAVPDGWRWVRIRDIAHVVGGSTPSRNESGFWGGEIPWVVPSELTKMTGRYLTITNECITELGMASAGLTPLPVGSVLLTSRATIGTVAINKMPVATNQGFQNLVVKEGADTLWLYYYVSSVKRELERRASGSTFLEISRDNVRSLPILLPPLAEQRAIAAVLDSIDEAIERTEEVIAATEVLRDSLLHELLTRGVPGWHTEWKEVPGIGTIPAAWEVVRLGDVAEVNPRRESLALADDMPVTFLPMASVSEHLGGITGRETRAFSEVKQGYTYFRADDVLFAKITPCLQNGKHTLATGLLDGFGFGTTEFHVIRAGAKIDRRQLFRAVTRDYIIDRCTNSFTGTAGQQRVQPEVLRSIPLGLPTLQEQAEIAQVLDALDTNLEDARVELSAFQAVKSSVADVVLASGRAGLRRSNGA